MAKKRSTTAKAGKAAKPKQGPATVRKSAKTAGKAARPKKGPATVRKASTTAGEAANIAQPAGALEDLVAGAAAAPAGPPVVCAGFSLNVANHFGEVSDRFL